MLKKTIKYVDYDGNQREEDFYFHLNKAELMEMAHSEKGGLVAYCEKIIATQDNKKLIDLFKGLVLMAYGEKSLDGRQFIKNQDVRDSFAQTEAYSELFMELATNAEAASAFVNGIIPTLPQDHKTAAK